ncbi:MAG TPA: flagellar basal body L-ring protein FlgH [Burkholderiaceae bacterium]
MNARLQIAALFLLAAGLVCGCSMTPPTVVQHPTTTLPERTPPQPGNGAIFQTASYRPLFEDYRARAVGDLLIMTINENTKAGKTNANTDTKAGSVAVAAPTLLGSTNNKLSFAASSGNKFSDAGAITSSNNFTGTMGLTVVDVLANGNLVVSGEKQIALDKSTEYVRFSGVVSPSAIVGNTVSSTDVADARVEYRTNSHYDVAELMSELSRFVQSLAPF